MTGAAPAQPALACGGNQVGILGKEMCIRDSAAGARGPLAHVARDGSRHVRPALRHAFGNDPVVGEEYRERTGKLGHLGAPLSCGDTRDGVFKVCLLYTSGAERRSRGARVQR